MAWWRCSTHSGIRARYKMVEANASAALRHFWGRRRRPCAAGHVFNALSANHERLRPSSDETSIAFGGIARSRGEHRRLRPSIAYSLLCGAGRATRQLSFRSFSPPQLELFFGIGVAILVGVS